MWNLFEEIQSSWSFNSLRRHQMTHTGEKSFTCKTCLKKFSWSSHLNTHQLTHTGEKSFTCETCLKKFSQAGNLRAHQMTHTGEKSFECETCLKKFNRASLVDINTHTGEKSFTCEICQENFCHGNSVSYQVTKSRNVTCPWHHKYLWRYSINSSWAVL